MSNNVFVYSFCLRFNMILRTMSPLSLLPFLDWGPSLLIDLFSPFANCLRGSRWENHSLFFVPTLEEVLRHPDFLFFCQRCDNSLFPNQMISAIVNATEWREHCTTMCYETTAFVPHSHVRDFFSPSYTLGVSRIPYTMAPFLKIGLEHNWSGSHQGETTASVSRVHKVVLRHTRLEPVP